MTRTGGSRVRGGSAGGGDDGWAKATDVPKRSAIAAAAARQPAEMSLSASRPDLCRENIPR
jgi:hypothetical protein